MSDRPHTVDLQQDAPPGAESTNGPADEALLAALAAGDTGAFDQLFARHSRTLYAFLSRMTAGRVDADDLLQETFLRVLTHAKDFRPGAPIRPWLFTIARNAALNAIKKTQLRGELEVQADLSDWQPPARPQQVPDPGRSAEHQEDKARALAALEQLPAIHREAVVLILFNGFSYEEAASITGELESTLRSRVFYALKKLRELLKEPM